MIPLSATKCSYLFVCTSTLNLCDFKTSMTKFCVSRSSKFAILFLADLSDCFEDDSDPQNFNLKIRRFFSFIFWVSKFQSFRFQTFKSFVRILLTFWVSKFPSFKCFRVHENWIPKTLEASDVFLDLLWFGESLKNKLQILKVHSFRFKECKFNISKLINRKFLKF